jgi:hypothetical protein
MATVNLGSIKFKWKGTYSGATAYTVDDVVEYNGSSYICILASTGNLPTNATYFEQMSSAGTNGTDLTSTLTTQGDIVYRDGSGLVRLGAGTAGQVLQTGGAGANPSWGTVSSGTYSVHAIDSYNYQSEIVPSTEDTYHDIAGGNYVSFQPTSTNDKIYLSLTCAVQNDGAGNGGDVYFNLGTSSTLGSSDTKLNFDGKHSHYQASETNLYFTISKSLILPCTTLSTSTTYYVEMAGAKYENNTLFIFNKASTGATGAHKGHQVNLIHYKYN